jgi:hypothetical protein
MMRVFAGLSFINHGEHEGHGERLDMIDKMNRIDWAGVGCEVSGVGTII